jgi:hypothetical protein
MNADIADAQKIVHRNSPNDLRLLMPWAGHINKNPFRWQRHRGEFALGVKPERPCESPSPFAISLPM